MQREIVDDIVQIRWKLRRIANIEATMMQRQQEQTIERHEDEIGKKARIQEPAPKRIPCRCSLRVFLARRGYP